MKLIAILPAAILLSAGCRSNGAATDTTDTSHGVTAVKFRDGNMRGGGSVNMLPRVVIYRTNGDYNDRVAVTLDATRTSLVSYPDPADVGTFSPPIVMDGGWLLDRRGAIGLNTAFLDWTYTDYAGLPAAPAPSEIMRHVIPSARVTATEVLPITATAALADTAAVNRWIRGQSENSVDQDGSKAVTAM